MTRIPVRAPRAPMDHEILVMTRIADLYATLNIEARDRVHHYVGERLHALPVIAEVKAESDHPALPFNRGASDEAAE